MTSNSFQFAFFSISFIVSGLLRLNVIQMNSKDKLKRIWRHWVEITCSVLIKRVYTLAENVFKKQLKKLLLKTQRHDDGLYTLMGPMVTSSMDEVISSPLMV